MSKLPHKTRREAAEAVRKALLEDPSLRIVNANDSNENGPYTIIEGAPPVDPSRHPVPYSHPPLPRHIKAAPSSTGGIDASKVPSAQDVLDEFTRRGVPFATRDARTGKIVYRDSPKAKAPNRKNIKVVKGPSPSSRPKPRPSGPPEFVSLTPALARSFLTSDEWEPLCAKIKEYRAELDKITEQLKKDKKKCTGCALNPYRAQIIPKLLEDFKDQESISDLEVEAIKKKLGVKFLQVGTETRGNKPYVR